MRRKSAQQRSVATAGIQHSRAGLQMAYIARQYAEAGELGKLRKEVPLPGGVLRFPGLRGLQQAIGPAAAVQERLQPTSRVIEKSIRAHALRAHGARSVPAGDAGNILATMSALPILCYHNVAIAPRDARFKLLYVSPDRFERQLWSLRRLGLRGVSMGEGMTRLRDGTARGCVALTFDDGYADTLATAAPLMQQYGVRATCYIVAGALGTYNRWDAEFLGERKPLMSRAQLDQWLALGMEVGSHSLSHRSLPELPQDAAFCEIAESRATLHTMLGVAVEHFAYPFGYFTAATVELVRRAGYSSAVTVLPGVALAS